MTNRREFLQAAAFSLVAAKLRADIKAMRGIFPIMQTPYTEAGQLDTEVLAKEVEFLDRAGAHGVVWPQLASEWSELKPEERSAGAETIMAAAKGARCAVVLGVHPEPVTKVVHPGDQAFTTISGLGDVSVTFE